MKKTKKSGFTLIEMLVVIVIITILATLLVPSVKYAIDIARTGKTKSLIGDLEEGAALYKNDNGYYPGQDLPSGMSLADDNSVGTLTGSQLLAAAVFKFEDTSDPDKSCYEALRDGSNLNFDKDAGYMVYSEGMLDDILGNAYTLIDPIFATHDTRMPILYYPSHMGENDEAQFKFHENFAYNDLGSAITSAVSQRQTDFQNWLDDYQKNGVTANNNTFLLMSAGLDKTFFTDDEVKNW